MQIDRAARDRAGTQARRNGGRTLGLAVALWITAAGRGDAQSVRGHIVEGGSGLPVAGALVVLVDSAGAEATATVSSERGTYLLRAPTPGRYTLRAQRIGFEDAAGAPMVLEPGESRSVRLVVSSAPIELPVLRVEREARCDVRPEEGRATYTLWEEARKALEIAEWTARKYVFDVVLSERLLDESGEVLEEDPERSVRIVGRHPFRSAPAEELMREGYVRATPQGAYYYGPDATVLLSDSFLDTHCFRYRGAATGDTTRVGLDFEPVRRGDVADIRGTLWLDRRTSGLRRVEFEYTRAPAAAGGAASAAHGYVAFDRLTSGAWIVRSWGIRTPAGTRQRGIRTVSILSEDGGRVLGARPLSGRAGGGRPVPSVYDRLDRGARPDGAGSVTTDSSGTSTPP